MLRIGIKPLAGKSEHCIREAVLSASPDTMVADSYHLYLTGEVQRLTSSSKWEISPLDHHTQCSLPLAHRLMLLARRLQHQGFPGGLHGKESAYQAGELGLIPGSGRCPGLLCAGRASPRPAQLLAFAPGKEQAAGVWEP